MMKRGHDDEYEDCRQFVEKLLPEALKVAEEVKEANERAWARNESYFAKKYQAWIDEGGARTGSFNVGTKVWLAVPPSVTSNDSRQGKLQCHWRGPLIILSRKGYTYRLATATGVVLQSAVHAERLRVYNERQPYKPTDDVEINEEEWQQPLEVEDRANPVNNDYSNKRPVRILDTRTTARRRQRGKRRVEWLVEFDDGTTKWTLDSALKERRLVEEFKVRFQGEEGGSMN
jgi:hypothetical protein